MSLVEDIFLSDFMIFILLCVLLLAVTSWAFRSGELPGYALGWLVGIFMVVVYSALGGGVEVTVDEMTNAEPVRLTMVSVMIASLFGLVGGFGVLTFVQAPIHFPQRRSITIALLTTMVIIGLYILSTSGEYTRKSLGIFALAFAIGLLANIVLNGNSATRRAVPVRLPPDYPATGTPGEIPHAGDSVQNRFDRLRRRIERR